MKTWHYMWEEKTIPCRWCGNPTPMLGTKLCDACWELETRIGRNPELAKRMLDAIGKKEKKYAGTHRKVR